MRSIAHDVRGRRKSSEREWRRNEETENTDLAERQEGRRLDHGDVRDLARRQRAELFGADHASEEGHRRSRRQGLVHLRRPRRRLAADADTGAARHPGDVLRQRALHRGLSRRGQADRQVRLRHRRAFLHAGRSAVVLPAGRAGRADPQEHRPARRLRRQESHRLGQSGGGVHAGDRGPAQAERPVLDLRRHLHRSADQDSHAARPDRRRADHRLLRQPRAARLVARPVRRASRHLRLSAPARDDRIADAGDPLPVRRPRR